MKIASKPAAVEEPIDRWLHRPVAAWVVRVVPSPVQPDHLTLASGMLGLGAGVFAAKGWWLGAAFSLWSAVILDCADGQLARRRGTTSLRGRILDGAIDAISPLAVLAGTCVGLSLGTLGWSFAFMTVLSIGFHASSYDREKNRFLAAVHPDFDPDALLTPSRLRREAAVAWREGRALDAVLFAVWSAWTRGQRPVDPASLPMGEDELRAFRRLFTAPMARRCWLGFGFHLALLYLSLAAAHGWGRDAVFVGWAIICGPLNALAALASIRSRRRERGWRDFLRRMR